MMPKKVYIDIRSDDEIADAVELMLDMMGFPPDDESKERRGENGRTPLTRAMLKRSENESK